MRRWKTGLGLLAITMATGTTAVAQTNPAVPVRDLAVVGVTQIGDRTQAWLVDLRTRGRLTVSPGDTAFGYRVKQVEPERVVLTRGSQQFTLRMGEKRVLPAAAPVTPAVPVALEPLPGGALTLPAVPEALPLDFLPEEEPVLVEPEPVRRARSAPPSPGVEVDRDFDNDPRTLPELYPGYGQPPGYQWVPGYGWMPGYPPAGDPALGPYPYLTPGYPTMVDPYAGGVYPFPAAPYALPGGAPGYPGMLPPAAPAQSPLAGYLPGFPSDAARTPWGRPDAGWPGYSGYISGFPTRRWNPQATRREGGDYFRGGSPANPQTHRRRGAIGYPR